MSCLSANYNIKSCAFLNLTELYAAGWKLARDNVRLNCTNFYRDVLLFIQIIVNRPCSVSRGQWPSVPKSRTATSASWHNLIGFVVITRSVAPVAEMKGNRLNYYVKCVDESDGTVRTHVRGLFIELSLIDGPRFCALVKNFVSAT